MDMLVGTFQVKEYVAEDESDEQNNSQPVGDKGIITNDKNN